MADAIIKVEHLSKHFLIGQQQAERYTALRDVIARNVKGVFSKTRDIMKGKVHGNDSFEEFWALKDVNFEIRQGDRVGIIGRNGAGKSTLLKVLSRITEPSGGRITIKGRVASLLEVGTGFHPELTGRENVFLNGAILGMSRAEIRKKFDEIVAFAEVEKFLDTPVKRYSSGMYVRLAFSVAAHLEPEILVVDEVLAVGDVQFQQKCLGKMEDVSKNQGRTVLFVSHNIPSLLQLCDRGIVLHKGSLDFDGDINSAVDRYISSANKMIVYEAEKDLQNGFRTVSILNDERKPAETHRFDKKVMIDYVLNWKEPINNAHLSINLYDNKQRAVFSSDHVIDPSMVKGGEYRVFVELPDKFLLRGSYLLNTAVHIPNVSVIDKCFDKLFFNIEDSGNELSIYNGQDYGVVYVNLKWSHS